MKAFHGQEEIKTKYINRVLAHMKSDELVKGKYWEGGKGCAVGCTIHSSDHGAYEVELGIPRIIARLEDGIFEKLPNELSQTWPHRFLEAIKPGADLSLVWSKFAYWMMLDKEYGVIQFAKASDQKKAIKKVGDLYKKQASGKKVKIEDWRLARAAAAAAYAAYAAAAAYAAYAAAADAYAAYAAYAADAAYAAYAAAARTKWRIAQSEKLLELLRDAK